MFQEHFVDHFLAHPGETPPFSHIDALRFPARIAQDAFIDEIVVKHHVRLLQQAQAAHGDQLRVAGPRAHERNRTGGRAGLMQFPFELFPGFFDFAFQHQLAGGSADYAIPEFLAGGDGPDRPLHCLAPRCGEFGEAAQCGRQARLEPGTHDSRERRRTAAGGNRDQHRVAIDDAWEDG